MSATRKQSERPRRTAAVISIMKSRETGRVVSWPRMTLAVGVADEQCGTDRLLHEAGGGEVIAGEHGPRPTGLGARWRNVARATSWVRGRDEISRHLKSGVGVESAGAWCGVGTMELIIKRLNQRGRPGEDLRQGRLSRVGALPA